jgi:hypothetical protein
VRIKVLVGVLAGGRRMGDRGGKWNIRPSIRPRDIAAIKRGYDFNVYL